jgi:leader peptidase (prepilin peptidase)/N-methyltransferase
MNAVHHAVLAAFGFVVGAAVGSFVNVCAWRLPRGESLVHPASRCPRCGTAIRTRDNLPILGWLLLGGRCRGCRGPIAARYPIVEAVVAVLFAVIVLAETLPGGPLDPLDRGLAGVAVRVAYHWMLAAILTTAILIEIDRRAGLAKGTRVPRAGRNPAALLAALLVLDAYLSGDHLGALLSLVLLLVYLRAARAVHTRVARVGYQHEAPASTSPGRMHSLALRAGKTPAPPRSPSD